MTVFIEFFPRADGSAWKHPAGNPGHQKWHGRHRASPGSQRPTQHDAEIRQLNSAVSQSGTGETQLWPKHAGVPHEPEEEPATEARLAAKDHYSRLDWRELHWQMVADDLPNRLFFFQRSLLALLCQIITKKGHRSSQNKQQIWLLFLSFFFLWFSF